MLINLVWVLVAILLGFGISYIFSGLLKIPRNLYLLIFIPVVYALSLTFYYSSDMSIKDLITHNWYWGLLGAAIATVIVVRNVFSQPSSKRNRGIALAGDIIWPGFLYGLADSLLLTIIPVLSVYMAFPEAGWTDTWAGKILLGLIALIASSVTTVAYHLGYKEFRNKNVLWTVFGNGIMSLAFILSFNPLAVIIPHTIMHIAAIFHGKDTTGQVPPHY
jgi:hypothetical protein